VMKLNLTLFVIDGDYYLRQIQQVFALYPLQLNTQLRRARPRVYVRSTRSPA